ncbi:hypothetical protein QQY66_33315 [Streptomyces sp. DG2A-72]|uniref:hypothetical protein n=1 Tax=Streptomyces sp. DG2A-72 TaxID=3051386 RepID=UPI00265C20A5|nr:hypothetical protein [Streptomyces sp. DG2A-72]MDO0936344.1 hypothetical protein [Streptomyces sp. DG2A-72]
MSSAVTQRRSGSSSCRRCAIRGSAHTITITVGAFGPLAISFGHDLTGHYGTALIALPAVPTVVALAVLVARKTAGRRLTHASNELPRWGDGSVTARPLPLIVAPRRTSRVGTVGA